MKKIIIVVFVVALLSFLGYKFFANTKQVEVTSDSSLSKIKERGTLIIGSSPPYGFMEFYDKSNNMVGVDIDIASEIARIIGVKLVTKEISYDVLDKAVAAGEVDLGVASISITPEREEVVLLSTPYFNGGRVAVVRSSDTSIKNLTDLSGKKVGSEFNNTENPAAEIEGFIKGSKVVIYKQDDAEKPYPIKIVEELNNNKIDAFVIDYVAAVGLMKEDAKLKILGDPFTQEFYGISTKFGNDSLMAEVNNIIKEMKRSGQLDQIKNKWLK